MSDENDFALANCEKKSHVVQKLSFPPPDQHALAVNDENCDKVKVFLRLRPQKHRVTTRSERRKQKIKELGSNHCIKVINNTTVQLSNPSTASSRKLFNTQFSFSQVFSAESSQSSIFNDGCKDLISNLVKGQNGLLFAYGVTNAGKTYTIEGTKQKPGIIPQALKHIFSLSEQHPGSRIYVSFLQIYNEQVHDLQRLSGSTKASFEKAKVNLKFKNNKVITENLSLTLVKNVKAGMKILSAGKKRRKTDETKLNMTSSRSHSVFGIHFEQKNGRKNKLFIVDLAGTERGKRTKPSRQQQQEASCINSSLMNLMNCLDIIRQNQKKKTSKLVPYRLSKLTLLFRDILLKPASSGVVMIVNCSTEAEDFDENLHALKYGTIVKQIRLKHLPQESAITKNLTTKAVGLPVSKLKRSFSKFVEQPSHTIASELSKIHEFYKERIETIMFQNQRRLRHKEEFYRRKSISASTAKNVSDTVPKAKYNNLVLTLKTAESTSLELQRENKRLKQELEEINKSYAKLENLNKSVFTKCKNPKTIVSVENNVNGVSQVGISKQNLIQQNLESKNVSLESSNTAGYRVTGIQKQGLFAKMYNKFNSSKVTKPTPISRRTRSRYRTLKN